MNETDYFSKRKGVGGKQQIKQEKISGVHPYRCHTPCFSCVGQLQQLSFLGQRPFEMLTATLLTENQVPMELQV